MLKLNIQLFANGGTLVIGTDLDTSTLERKINKLETKLKNEETDLKIKASNVDNVKKDLQDVYKEVNNLIKKREELNKKEQEYRIVSGKISKGEAITPAEYMQYENLAKQMQDVASQQSRINSEMDRYNDKINKLNDDLTKAEYSYNKQKDKVTETTQEVTKLKNEMQKTAKVDFSSAKNNINGIGNSIENVIKKVARWALAVFGVRSAYSAIRSAMGILSQYDEQMATNIEYIRYLLASTLKPIVEYIIQLAYKLLVYIGYIAKAWFGVNIFANASVEAFKKVNSGVKNTNKSAKELQKTLAGFDEMNILQKDGSTALGGGGGGIAMPDFKPFESIKIPNWVDWIAKNGKTIRDILLGIAGAIAAIKLGKLISQLAGFGSGVSLFRTGITLAIGGLLLLGAEIVNVLKNYENMTRMQKTVATALGSFGGSLAGIGIAVATGASAIGIALGSIVGSIAGVIAITGTMIYKHEQERKAISDVAEQEKRLQNIRKEAAKVNDEYIQAVDNQTEAQKNLKKVQDETGISGEELYKKVQNGEITYKNMTEQQKKTYKAYWELISANETLTEKENEKIDIDQKVVEQEYNKQIAADKTGKSYDKLKDDIIKSWEKGELKTEQATTLMEKLVRNMSQKNTKAFTKDLPDAISNGLDVNKYKSTMDKLINWFSRSFDDIKKKASITVSLGGSINNIASGISYYTKGYAKGGIVGLPKLAPGGIINQPGRGIPIASAIAGERGAEGVIPLTDSQQMMLLGEAIGRYITVNANIINTMNGRIISKELQKINNESDFAFNR